MFSALKPLRNIYMLLHQKSNTINSLEADVVSLNVQTSHIQQQETRHRTRTEEKVEIFGKKMKNTSII